MATVRELVVALGLDFESTGFAKAEQAIGALKTGLAGVGAILAGLAAGLTAITVSVARQADELNDFSIAIGVSTDQIQRLGFAAQMSGANQETMKTALMFLARNASQAADGGKEAAESFGKFGIALRDQEGHLKTADRLLLDAANGISQIKSPTEQAAAAAQLLGRQAGPQLVQLLKQGEAGIAQLGDELEELGGMMDTEFVEAAAEFNDTLDRLQTVIGGVSGTIAKAFLPNLAGAVQGLVAWYKANREVINSRVTFFAERMASAFSGLGHMLWAAMTSVTKLVRTFAESNPMFAKVIVMAGLLALAFASPAFAIVLLSALILAIADDINVFVTGGKSVLGNFVDFMIEWGKKNGGVLGDFIADVGKFLKDFKGAGWEAVIKEVNAHFEILANTLNTIWGVMQKISAVGGIVKDALLPDTGISAETLAIADPEERRKAMARDVQAKNAEREDNLRTIGFGGAIDAGKAADESLAAKVGGLKGLISSADSAANAWLNGLFGVGKQRDRGGGIVGADAKDVQKNISSSAVSTTNATTTVGANTAVNATINVNAAPGQDTRDVGAGAVDRLMDEKRKAELRAARSEFVPAKAVP